MKQLMSNFKDLDKEVASQAVNIISETQELLGNGSLLVMGNKIFCYCPKSRLSLSMGGGFRRKGLAVF